MIDIRELSKQVSAKATKRAGGRAARMRERTNAPVIAFPTLQRNIPVYELLPAEAVEIIHDESMKILEEIGIEFRDEESLVYWRAAGATVENTRVHIDRDLLMSLVRKAPRQFTLNARNPQRSVRVGERNSIFIPMYGAPYVRDLDGKRRYGTKDDLYNFHRLAQMSPALHSSSSIICEPMDVPVPHRHLHINYGTLRWSDKPYMGIVTSKDRAEDTIAMAKIVFGDDFVRDNPVMASVVNANSPLVWDATMLDALKIYAAHNQPCLISPFALCGASTSASTVGSVAQVNAEALAGIAFTQLVRSGCPMVYGQFMVAVDMKTGAPMGGTPEAAQMTLIMGQLARFYGLPFRTSAFHVGSKIADAQAGYEGNMLMHAAILSGAHYIWHAAGWLEAGLTCGYGKFMLDAEQCEGWYRYAQGVNLDDLQDAMAAVRQVGPAGHFLGTQHTLDHFEKAFFMPSLMDFNSWEQWSAEGEHTAEQRGVEKAKALLANYEEPELDQAVHEELLDFIARREAVLPTAAA
ncbi:trimethylamine--corrinoid protein Co-methyltransferase [Rhodoligotrophos appendicifer]|uniref:trimethylamine methyltransferase family protein n=1 Tax=Rhodoligotrophos appendicifer TaxID=987056 RepID=UPI001FEAE3D4|nr:trimethylamine methyltransferase family protein [Rhodoligotrophos appendicifer]